MVSRIEVWRQQNKEEEMLVGEIVPVGDKKKAPTALAIALADQQKLHAQKYEELDDDIIDGVTDAALTSRLKKHKFSDEPNWMVDGITGTCVRAYVCVCACTVPGPPPCARAEERTH